MRLSIPHRDVSLNIDVPSFVGRNAEKSMKAN